MKQEMSRKKYVLFYTLCFAAFCLGVFFLFIRKGKSMVWNQDGGPQYLPYLAYMGRYLRDFFSRALHGDFRLKMFDFAICFGNDVQTVVRAHPLDFLSVFVPTSYTEVLYHVIIIIRWYLAGLCFSYFASGYAPRNVYMTMGSLIYVFSGFLLVYGVRHPIYASAMIMLPLLLAGAEKILQGEGFWLFSFSVFLGFICNYYFMYEAAIACFIFALVRFFALYRENRLKYFIRLLFFFAGAFLAGAAMAMVTLLPVIRSLRSSARLAEQSRPDGLLLFDNWRHYYRWFLYMISPNGSLQGGISLNYCVLVIPCAAMMIGKKKKTSFQMPVFVLISVILLLSPVFSYVFSGFSAVNGRWVFIISLLAGMICTLYAPDLLRMETGQKRALAVLSALYAALAFYDRFSGGRACLIWPALLLAAAAVFLLILQSLPEAGPAGGMRILPYLLLLVCLVSCSANSYFIYSGRFGNALSEYYKAGTGIDMILRSEFSKFSRVKDESFHRMDSNLINSNRENYSLLLDYYPTSVYNSVISGPVTYGLLCLESPGIAAIHRIQGLDGSTVPENLANVRYFLTTVDGDMHAPYGFVRSDELSDGDNAIFVNEHPLSFGVTTDRVISLSDYEKLDSVHRAQVMLEACVLDDDIAEKAEGFEHVTDTAVAIESVPLTLPETSLTAVRTDTGYKIKKAGTGISMSYEKRAGYEGYLRLSGFSTGKVSTYVQLCTSDLLTQFLMRGPGTIYSLNRVDYTLRLGCFEEDAVDTLSLIFTEKGKYKLASASVFYVPVSSYDSRIEELNRESFSDAAFDLNTVSGDVSLSRNAIMMFSIPYSEGWSAKVDNERTKVLCSDISWCALSLEKGDHHIEFRYESPGAKTGRWISLAAWLGFVISLVLHRRRLPVR